MWPKHWMNSLDIPLDKDPSASFVGWILGGISMLIYAVVSLGALVTLHLRWSDFEYTHRWSIEVPSTVAVERHVAETLREVLTQDFAMQEVAGLKDNDLATIVPFVVTVTPLHTQTATLATALQKVQGLVPEAKIEPIPPKAQLSQLSHLVLMGAGATVLILTLVCLITLIAATRSALDIHAEVIRILQLLGANHTYIMRQFSRFNLVQMGRAIGVAVVIMVPLFISVAHFFFPRLAQVYGGFWWGVSAGIITLTLGLFGITRLVTWRVVRRHLARAKG